MTAVFTPIQGLRGLAQFGINPLTGEACAFGLRVLCDVNQEGLALLSDYFGAPALTLGANWNQSVNDQPSIGSIMLPSSIALDLATFALFRKGALAVVTTSDRALSGIFEQERLDAYNAYLATASIGGTSPTMDIRRNPRSSNTGPMQGSRNVHAATGRSV